MEGSGGEGEGGDVSTLVKENYGIGPGKKLFCEHIALLRILEKLLTRS